MKVLLYVVGLITMTKVVISVIAFMQKRLLYIMNAGILQGSSGKGGI